MVDPVPLREKKKNRDDNPDRSRDEGGHAGANGRGREERWRIYDRKDKMMARRAVKDMKVDAKTLKRLTFPWGRNRPDPALSPPYC